MASTPCTLNIVSLPETDAKVGLLEEQGTENTERYQCQHDSELKHENKSPCLREYFDAVLLYAKDDVALATNIQRWMSKILLTESGECPKIGMIDHPQYGGSNVNMPMELIETCQYILVVLTKNFHNDTVAQYLKEELIGETRIGKNVHHWKRYCVRVLHTTEEPDYNIPFGLASVSSYDVYNFNNEFAENKIKNLLLHKLHKRKEQEQEHLHQIESKAKDRKIQRPNSSEGENKEDAPFRPSEFCLSQPSSTGTIIPVKPEDASEPSSKAGSNEQLVLAEEVAALDIYSSSRGNQPSTINLQSVNGLKVPETQVEVQHHGSLKSGQCMKQSSELGQQTKKGEKTSLLKSDLQTTSLQNDKGAVHSDKKRSISSVGKDFPVNKCVRDDFVDKNSDNALNSITEDELFEEDMTGSEVFRKKLVKDDLCETTSDMSEKYEHLSKDAETGKKGSTLLSDLVETNVGGPRSDLHVSEESDQLATENSSKVSSVNLEHTSNNHQPEYDTIVESRLSVTGRPHKSHGVCSAPTHEGVTLDCMPLDHQGTKYNTETEDSSFDDKNASATADGSSINVPNLQAPGTINNIYINHSSAIKISGNNIISMDQNTSNEQSGGGGMKTEDKGIDPGWRPPNRKKKKSKLGVTGTDSTHSFGNDSSVSSSFSQESQPRKMIRDIESPENSLSSSRNDLLTSVPALTLQQSEKKKENVDDSVIAENATEPDSLAAVQDERPVDLSSNGCRDVSGKGDNSHKDSHERTKKKSRRFGSLLACFRKKKKMDK